MESTSKKHVEVEDKEILIKSSNGYMAIIPKNMAPWVREHIESGNHHIVDGYVKGLQEIKDGGKAQDGGKILPKTKIDVEGASVKRINEQDVKDLIMPSDATAVRQAQVEKILPGRLLPEIEITAPAKPIKYDEINYLNPFDSKYVVTKLLKKANTALGGNIEKGGYNRESYSDLISRLEQTPGTLQNSIKNTPNIPNVPNLPFAIAAPVNLGINAFNTVRPEVNRVAAATGDVVLDPVNWVPAGRAVKGVLKGAASLINVPKLTKRLNVIANASPYIDRGLDVLEAGESYANYDDKPRISQPVVEDLTPEQKKLLEKVSKYNFNAPPNIITPKK